MSKSFWIGSSIFHMVLIGAVASTGYGSPARPEKGAKQSQFKKDAKQKPSRSPAMSGRRKVDLSKLEPSREPAGFRLPLERKPPDAVRRGPLYVGSACTTPGGMTYTSDHPLYGDCWDEGVNRAGSTTPANFATSGHSMLILYAP